MLVKSLVALATEKMLLKTSGKTFLKGIDFMYAAGLAPERLSVMMTASGKYVLQFHSKCDIRPFAANYPSFSRVLRGIVHVRAWRIKSIEFVNVAFDMKDADNLERAIEKLGVELVLLRNCTYPAVRRGEEAIRFLNALNRKKQAVVCEYGDDRLKHRISRRFCQHSSRRDRAANDARPEEVVEGVAAAAAAAAPAPVPVVNAAAAPEAAPAPAGRVNGNIPANEEAMRRYIEERIIELVRNYPRQPDDQLLALDQALRNRAAAIMAAAAFARPQDDAPGGANLPNDGANVAGPAAQNMEVAGANAPAAQDEEMMIIDQEETGEDSDRPRFVHIDEEQLDDAEERASDDSSSHSM